MTEGPRKARGTRKIVPGQSVDSEAFVLREVGVVHGVRVPTTCDRFRRVPLFVTAADRIYVRFLHLRLSRCHY